MDARITSAHCSPQHCNTVAMLSRVPKRQASIKGVTAPYSPGDPPPGGKNFCDRSLLFRAGDPGPEADWPGFKKCNNCINFKRFLEITKKCTLCRCTAPFPKASSQRRNASAVERESRGGFLRGDGASNSSRPRPGEQDWSAGPGVCSSCSLAAAKRRCLRFWFLDSLAPVSRFEDDNFGSLVTGPAEEEGSPAAAESPTTTADSN